MRLLLASCATMLTLASGCIQRVPSSIRFSPQRRSPPAHSATTAHLRSAHFAFDDARQWDGQDGLTLVFSEDVDAASLRPDAFLVVLGDGSRVFPIEALLSPASEGDENRTVLLLGDFGDPRRRPPADVVVVRPLHTETGRTLQGQMAPVSAFDRGDEIVAAERGATPCKDGTQRIRLFWSDVLRAVEPADLAAVEVEFASGARGAPSAFEDHRAGAEAAEDNVLDLCVDPALMPVAVTVPAGLFSDAAGHLNVATHATVAPLPTAK